MHKLVRAHEFFTQTFCIILCRMWSNWFEDAKKKAGEALKQTTQIMSEVRRRVSFLILVGPSGCQKEG